MPISKKKPPAGAVEGMDRIIQQIYDDINDVINSVNQSENAMRNLGKGKVGDIKVKGQYSTPVASEDTIDLSSSPSGTTAHKVVIGQGDTSTHVGVIAQELEAVCPDCIKVGVNGVKTVNTDELFWHMLNAIKELSTKVKALEAG